MGAVLWGDVVALLPGCIGFNFAEESPLFKPRSGHDFRHDRATIGPRSGLDPAARASSIVCRSTGDDSAPVPRHLCLDRGSIAPRSRLDRDAIVEFFLNHPAPSDEDLIVMTIPPVRWRSDAPGGSTRVEKVANDCSRQMMIG